MNRPGRDTDLPDSVEFFSVEQIAIRCGVEPDFVTQLVAHGVIDPIPGRPAVFYSVVTLRVLKVVRIQRDLESTCRGPR